MDELKRYGKEILLRGYVEEIVINELGVSYKIKIDREVGDSIIGWFHEGDFVKDSSQNVSS